MFLPARFSSQGGLFYPALFPLISNSLGISYCSEGCEIERGVREKVAALAFETDCVLERERVRKDGIANTPYTLDGFAASALSRLQSARAPTAAAAAAAETQMRLSSIEIVR